MTGVVDEVAAYRGWAYLRRGLWVMTVEATLSKGKVGCRVLTGWERRSVKTINPYAKDPTGDGPVG